MLRKMRLRLSLRLLLLVVALFAVLFAWKRVQFERRRNMLKAELDGQEHVRKHLQISPVVPGMEAIHQARIKSLEVEIAEKRERLGLQNEK